MVMPHLCQYCGKASFGEAQLARHIRSNHLDSYRFQLQLLQGAQLGIVHELPPGLSICQVCGLPVAEMVTHLAFVHPEHSESTGPRSFSSARVPPLAATGTMWQEGLLPRELPAEPAYDGGLIASDDEELNEAPLPRVDYFDSAALCEDW